MEYPKPIHGKPKLAHFVEQKYFRWPKDTEEERPTQHKQYSIHHLINSLESSVRCTFYITDFSLQRREDPTELNKTRTRQRWGRRRFWNWTGKKMNTDITASTNPEYPVIDRNPPFTTVVGNFSTLDYFRFATITGVSVTVGYLSGLTLTLISRFSSFSNNAVILINASLIFVIYRD